MAEIDKSLPNIDPNALPEEAIIETEKKALHLAKLFLPYCTVKRERLLKIINHYEFIKPKESLGKKFSFLKTTKT